MLEALGVIFLVVLAIVLLAVVVVGIASASDFQRYRQIRRM